MDSEAGPGRTQATRCRFSRPSYLVIDPNRIPGSFLELPNGRDGWLVARRIRIVRRGLAVLAWTLFAMVIQAACLIAPGRTRVTFPRIYWATFARLIGIE